MKRHETRLHKIRNDGVGGSSPSCGTNKIKDLAPNLRTRRMPWVAHG
jgi:hypothetical protein